MVQSTPLRLSLKPQDDETAFSYMSLLSARNGVSVSEFGLDQDISFQKVLDGNSKAIAALAWLGGASTETLLKSTPQKLSNRQHRFCCELFPSKIIRDPTVRGCPICLKEDAEGLDLRPHWSMALRGHWMIPHVAICSKHNHPLVALWRDSSPHNRYDISSQMEKIASSILSGNFDQELREPTDFDKWLDHRLQNGPGTSWLDSYKLHATANFCFILGCSLLRHGKGIQASAVAKDRYWVLYRYGFEVAYDGEESIQIELDRLTDLEVDAKQGPKSIFPVLYERLSRDYKDAADFDPFRDILRRHMLKSWPLGIGDDLLGEPVSERQLHSVVTASREYGIDQRRLRKMLEGAGIVTGTRPDKWTVFDAKAAEPLLASLVTLLPAKNFAENLNMSRSQFNLLVEDHILEPALLNTDTKHVWDPRTGHEFLESILIGAEELRQAQHGWEHIAKSALRLKQRPSAIIQAIRDGRIHRVGKHRDFVGYAGVFVYHDEVIAALDKDAPNAMSLELFAKTVGIRQPTYLNRLIINGHTTATQMKNPKTNAMQPYVTTADARRFHQNFYTLRTLAKETGHSWQKLSGILAMHEITPFSPKGVDYGRIFSRSDIEIAFPKAL